MPLLTAPKAVVCRLSLMPRFPRLAGLWMLGILTGPVLEGILSTATTCWRLIVFEIGIPTLLPYSWILEGRWGFENASFHFFCIFSFQCLDSACRILLQPSESLPIGLFLYSATTSYPASVESAILIYFSFSVWRWLPLMTLKLDPVCLKCYWWCPEDFPLNLCKIRVAACDLFV